MSNQLAESLEKLSTTDGAPDKPVDDASNSAVLERHKSECDELAKSYEKKKSFIRRKDKAGRARLKEEQDADETQLQKRHASERAAAGITDEEAKQTTEQPAPAAPDTNGGRKESRAARRRRLKAEEEAASDARVAEFRANADVSARETEMAAIQARLDGQSLRVHPIAPDGHCLYNAVAHQMALAGPDRFEVSAAVPALRAAAADYMLANADEFIMFVSSARGDPERFRVYCEDVRVKAVWAGQVEIRALAETLGATIEVYVPYMEELRMGNAESGDVPVLRVSYHQKYYGLGEHYNSVVPRKATGNEA